MTKIKIALSVLVLMLSYGCMVTMEEHERRIYELSSNKEIKENLK